MITGGAASGDHPPSELLRLRPPRLDDEAAFRAAHQVMAAEGFTFGFGLEPATRWSTYLNTLQDHHCGRHLAEGRVPATFTVADVAGVIVGRASIRHELNDRLRQEGGHIGYAVLPAYRRRGYATEILRQSLIIARAHGVGRALLTCDDDNTGSIAVIENCGGRLDSVIRLQHSAIPVRPVLDRQSRRAALVRAGPVIRAGRPGVHGQQPDQVGVQRVRRDARQRGLQGQHALLDPRQAGPGIRPRPDGHVISQAGPAPAALGQQVAGQQRRRVPALEVRRGRRATSATYRQRRPSVPAARRAAGWPAGRQRGGGGRAAARQAGHGRGGEADPLAELITMRIGRWPSRGSRVTLFLHCAHAEVAVTAGAGNEMAAAAAGHGHLRASHADRERVIAVLKIAFVQERLAKDEFDVRLSQTFAARTYADLAGLTADLPAGLTDTHPSRQPAAAQDQPVSKPLLWCACAFIVAGMGSMAAAFPVGNFLLLVAGVLAILVAAPVAGTLMLDSWREKRSGGSLPPRAAQRDWAPCGERTGRPGDDLILCQAREGTFARPGPDHRVARRPLRAPAGLISGLGCGAP